LEADMAIGLTFRQLLTTFTESLDKRDKELNTEILLAKEGFNPSTKQYMDEYRKMFPDLTEKQSLAFTVYLSAILDTIVRNNEAIEKSFLDH
jgi:hypothetical protein